MQAKVENLEKHCIEGYKPMSMYQQREQLLSFVIVRDLWDEYKEFCQAFDFIDDYHAFCVGAMMQSAMSLDKTKEE